MKKILTITDEDLLRIPARPPGGNKGTYGKLLVVAGSEDICGAAFFAAKAALLTGIGMVRIFTHAQNRIPLSCLFPEALLTTCTQETWNPDLLVEALAWSDAAVIGPGLGKTALSADILHCFAEKNTGPAVLDADALNLLAEEPVLFETMRFPHVITPHIGEMSRLINTDAQRIKDEACRVAAEAAGSWNTVCVLKDARTITAYPDGRIYCNESGNNALATAGSGDVLAGLLGGLLLRKNPPELPIEAIGVHLHGRIGERAAERIGKASVIASDLLSCIHEFM